MHSYATEPQVYVTHLEKLKIADNSALVGSTKRPKVHVTDDSKGLFCAVGLGFFWVQITCILKPSFPKETKVRVLNNFMCVWRLVCELSEACWGLGVCLA